MTRIIRYLLTICIGLLWCMPGRAVSEEELIRLETEMLKYLGTNERDTFYIITEQLKEASRQEGDERRFYKAWGYQGIYEATQQYYKNGLTIAKEMTEQALREGSAYGQFAAMHTEAMILMQQQDYDAAEQAFLNAVDFRHRRFPNESAAEDLRELMKIAYFRNDTTRAKNIAYQMLAEPNLTPHHKGRVLYRLSIMAFETNNVEEFNHIYDEMQRLEQTAGIKLLSTFIEVNYLIINDDYKQALRHADLLSADTCAERKAIIYHRLGDDEKAYEYMRQYKHISDSIVRVSHNNVVSNLYLRMNNDRLRLEQEVLQHQNTQLHNRFYFILGGALLFVLLLIIWKGRKLIKQLQSDNMVLNYGKKDAERALKDLNELSFFESKTELSLTSPVRLNKLCNRLTNSTQNHCVKGVTVIFMTEFSDDYEIHTNPEALEKLVVHLLNYSSRFTHEGSIWLRCTDSESFVRFTITDTSLGLGDGSKSQVVGMFVKEDNTMRYVGMNFNICQSITRLLHGMIRNTRAAPVSASRFTRGRRE